MRERSVFWVGLIAVSGAALWAPAVINPRPVLLYNPSPSAAIGWYRVEPQRTYKRGMIVAARLPEAAATLADERGYLGRDIPVIKTIWALEGDEVCVTGETISFSEQPSLRALQADRLGRKMPALERGCFRHEEDEVFLASNTIETSFDSRYFGPVRLSDLIGQAEYLGHVDSGENVNIGQLGWARGRGADCKIKEAGTKGSLTPCLHIDFYSAKDGWLVPRLRDTSVTTTGSAGTMPKLRPGGCNDK